MSSDESSPQPSGFPAQFSLRTLFLVINCVAIACLAFRYGESFDRGFFLAAVSLSAFFVIWFVVTGRFRSSAWALLAMLTAGLLLPFTAGPRIYSYQNHCRNALRQLGIALLSYRDQHGTFPPAYIADANGKPLYSWRVLLLPYLDNSPLAHRFHWDEPWDGSNNGPISATAVFEYHCPSDAHAPTTTNYVAVIGPNTAWPGARRRSISEFKDLSKTILLVEVADSGINWAEPRDLSVAQAIAGVNGKKGLGISSHHAGGANVLFADGHVEFIEADIVAEKLAAMLNINGKADAGR